MSLGGELVLVSACLTVTPLITDGPEHTHTLTLEDILEHVLGIKTMTSLILDHVATAYLYLGIITGEKVMILFLVIVLELSQD